MLRYCMELTKLEVPKAQFCWTLTNMVNSL